VEPCLFCKRSIAYLAAAGLCIEHRALCLLLQLLHLSGLVLRLFGGQNVFAYFLHLVTGGVCVSW
jgi:hypothetical protein